MNQHEKGTHSDHCEDNADGTKDSLGRSNAGKLLRKIRGLDSHIQRGENVFSTFRLGGVWIHSQRGTRRYRGQRAVGRPTESETQIDERQSSW